MWKYKKKMAVNFKNLFPYIWFAWIMYNGVYKARADIFTSVSKIKEIFLHEKRLLSGIKLALKNVDATPETMDILRFCQERQEYKKHENLKENVNVKHPNGAYKMIKHFVGVYQEIRQTIKKVNIPYLEMIIQDIPSSHDLQGARLSLLRLQEVYSLDPAKMADGNYRGFQGPPLDALDIFKLGLVAYEERKYKVSAAWFDIARIKCTMDESIKDPPLERVASLLDASRAMSEKSSTKQESKKVQLSTLIRALNTKCSQEHRNDVLDDEMKKVHSLCAKMDQRYLKNGPRHICRYTSMLMPYFRMREEILSSSPYVSVIYNITTPRESNAVQKLASRQLFRAGVQGQEIQGSNQSDSDYRTSHVAFLGEDDSKHLSSLTTRISRLTGLYCLSNPNGHRLEQSAGEKYQIVNYGIGGHYSVHLDTYEALYSGSQDILQNSGNRIATVLIYLSKVEIGGSTVFPWLNIAVPPFQHSALVWYNIDKSGSIDFRTRHAGCPVLVGDKWVMNKWILSHANTFQRPCGLRKTLNQRRIEKLWRTV